MVRYSKLPFRQTVREYNVDVAYTPMILSDVFRNSQLSRDIEFITHPDDDPVVVQFAAENWKDASDAAQLVAKYSNGVDINCGCPQKWAIKEGIGAALLDHPDKIKDIVDHVKRRTSEVKMADGSSFPCSIKIRIEQDLKRTVELCRRAEKVGVDWITVHGRTKNQKNSDPIDVAAIKHIKEQLSIPVYANGGITSSTEAEELVKKTNVDGVMVAQGLLSNPAMFAGHEQTPIEAVKKYVQHALSIGTTYFVFHHHLMFMLDKIMSKAEKKRFNVLYSIPAILDHLETVYGIELL